MKLSLFSIDHPRSAAIIHIFMAALVVVAALAALMTAGLNATGSSNAVTAEQAQLGGFRNGIRVTEAASLPSSWHGHRFALTNQRNPSPTRTREERNHENVALLH
jgi:hypothetical protein